MREARVENKIGVSHVLTLQKNPASDIKYFKKSRNDNHISWASVFMVPL